jgi:hypothetical protein
VLQEPSRRGIIPRTIHQLFDTIRADTNPNSRWVVRVSYLQIYKEVPVPASAPCR